MPASSMASSRSTGAFSVAWPGWLSRMDPPRRSFTLALIASLALHAVLLSIHFKLPDAIKRATSATLEVVLVNAKSARKPVKAQARAQANLDGGGNTDEDRRAKTPLPAAQQTQPGDSLVEAQRRVQELEAQQQKLLTQAKSKKAVQVETSRSEKQPEQSSVRGADLAQSALAIARMEAQIARQVEEYNKRPRKKFIGARTEEFAAAQYLEDWRQKVERIGNLNYPEAAKGRLYGNLLLYVEIKADGSLERVEVQRSSGHRILDEAALRIVRMAAPYGNFSAELKRQTDIVAFARTWVFTKADQLQSE
ncbi:MAG: energy transducer TonB [Rhodocyclaceae bacterium]|nr:energy transducer TonB [Rhodocyclaceae bacterium]MCZ7655021.1 energy transducer TonB [Rhodocyclaceae bacterium]